MGSYSTWLQMDLGSTQIVTGVVTQGFDYGSDPTEEFVTSFKVKASMWQNGGYWNVEGGKTYWSGATDRSTRRTNVFGTTQTARWIRIYPQTYKNHVSMRAGVTVSSGYQPVDCGMTISVSTRSKGGSCFSGTPSMESWLGESCSGVAMDTSPFSALVAKWLATSHAGGAGAAAAINPAGLGGFYGKGCRSNLDCNLNGACDKASGACACNAYYKGATCRAIDMSVACTTRATCTCNGIRAVCNDVAASPAASASVNNCADLKAKVPGVSCTDDGFIGTCDADPDAPGTFIRLSCTSPASFARPTAWVALVTLFAVAFVN